MGYLLAGLVLGLVLGFAFGRLVERANRAGSAPAEGGGEKKGPLEELKKGAKAVLIFAVLFAALAVASRHRNG